MWSVTLYTSPGGTATTESSNSPGNNGNTIAFSEPDGTYLYAISPPAGFLPEPSLGAVTVQGSNPSQVNINFVQSTTESATTFSGSGGSISYIYNGNSVTVPSNQNNVIQIPSGMQIFLTATPDSQHVFQKWTTTGSVTVSGSLPVSPSATLTVTGTGSVTANFASNLVVAITPLSASVQPGGSTIFTATAAGGSGGYSYLWTWEQLGGNPQHGSQNTGSSNQYTFTPPTTGSYIVYVTVTDSSGNSNLSLYTIVTVQYLVTPSNSQTLTVIKNQTNVYDIPPNDLTVIVPGGCQAVSGQQFNPSSAGCVGSSLQLPQMPIASPASSTTKHNPPLPLPFDESIEVQLTGGNAPVTIQASSLTLQATSWTYSEISVNGITESLPKWANGMLQCSLVSAGPNPYTGPAYSNLPSVTLQQNQPTWLTYVCKVQWNFIDTSNSLSTSVATNAASTFLSVASGIASSPTLEASQAILQASTEAYSLENNAILAAQINFGLSSAGLNTQNVYVKYSIVPYTLATAPGPKWSCVTLVGK